MHFILLMVSALACVGSRDRNRSRATSGQAQRSADEEYTNSLKEHSIAYSSGSSALKQLLIYRRVRVANALEVTAKVLLELMPTAAGWQIGAARRTSRLTMTTGICNSAKLWSAFARQPCALRSAVDHRSASPTLLQKDDDEDESEWGPRAQDKRSQVEQFLDIGMRNEGLWALIEGLKKSGLSATIGPGRVVVARSDVPQQYIVQSQTYEVKSIYYQGWQNSTVVKVPVDSIDANPPAGCENYAMYLTLFSPQYHKEPVILSPDEVELVPLRDEIFDALKVALPIISFYLVIISALLSYGNERAQR